MTEFKNNKEEMRRKKWVRHPGISQNQSKKKREAQRYMPYSENRRQSYIKI